MRPLSKSLTVKLMSPVCFRTVKLSVPIQCIRNMSLDSHATEIHISDVKYKSEVSYELLMVVQQGTSLFIKPFKVPKEKKTRFF